MCFKQFFFILQEYKSGIIMTNELIQLHSLASMLWNIFKAAVEISKKKKLNQMTVFSQKDIWQFLKQCFAATRQKDFDFFLLFLQPVIMG